MTEIRDRIRHPRLRQLYDYWKTRRGDRRFPARADVDPLDLKFALGNLTLVDVLYDPVRFHFRLTGSQFSQRIGLDLTGKTVDDIPDPAYRDQVRQIYRAMVESGEPSIARGERIIEGQSWEFEILRLPLSDDGVTVNMLLVCPMYFDQPPSGSVLGGPGERGFDPPRTIEDG